VKQSGLNYYIKSRLTKFAEKIIVDYQSVFRMNRGKIDSIHILRQVIVKAYEYNTQIGIYL